MRVFKFLSVGLTMSEYVAVHVILMNDLRSTAWERVRSSPFASECLLY